MGNKTSSKSEEELGDSEEGDNGSRVSKSVITKIRIMSKFSHNHRMRIEERTELYKALAELKEDRRRLSHDLEQERLTREGTRSIRELANKDIDTDKPSWAAYENDRFCALCKKPATRSLEYPCRICQRIFHKLCLAKCGECRNADLQAAEEALTNTGWSCYICGNLSLLLTELEINKLIEEFEVFDKNKDEHISWEEFTDQAKQSNVMSANRRGKFNLDDELDMKLDFKMADQDNDDCLDWWEFLNHHARILLANRSKEELVALLSEKEVIKCKTLFKSMDTDQDGALTLLEAKQAVRKWCKRFEQGASEQALAKLSPLIDLHSETRALMFVDADNMHRESISWPDFLEEQALYIICTRPNIASSSLETVIKEAGRDS